MKRNFVVGLFGSLVGFGMLFILLSAAGIVGAREADVPRHQARPGAVSAATPLTSTFTYQGQLKNSGNAVNGSCNMAFRLYDDPGGGNLIGSPITATVPINNGLFTVGLNFGNSAVTGIARWLDIRVRCPAGSGSYTPLTPRQALTPAPVALTFGAPGSVSGYLVAGASGPYYPTIGFNNSGPSDGSAYLAGVAGYGGLFQFHAETGDLTYYTGSNVPAGASHVNTPRLTIDANGNVGIGTTTPNSALTVQTATNNYGLVHTDGTAVVGTWVGEGGTGIDGGWIGTRSNHPLRFFTGDGQPTMMININDTVGIGTNTALARLTVRGFSTIDTRALEVQNSNNNFGLIVYDDRTVQIGALKGSSTIHACYSGLVGTNYTFAACNSAAEYVPSIDGGSGFPETADLVSIAPAIKNPYGDDHSPFVVEKTTKPCDDNLLGFIVNPESGADGKKLNDHYLPLAIYGYFPAKVTLENGAIQRGDPLTSSSKPGYAMKATQACKTIGYALEDADHEGTIQVFAHLSENAAPEVAALRAQVKQLKEQNAAFETRLAALENPVRSDSVAAAAAINPLNLSSAVVLIGFVWLWRQQRKRQ